MEFSLDSSSYFVTLSATVFEPEKRSSGMRTLLAKVPYLKAFENRSGNLTLEEVAGNVAFNWLKPLCPASMKFRVDKVDCSRSEQVPAVTNSRPYDFREEGVSFWDVTVK
jgi:hypothetical protein